MHKQWREELEQYCDNKRLPSCRLFSCRICCAN